MKTLITACVCLCVCVDTCVPPADSNRTNLLPSNLNWQPGLVHSMMNLSCCCLLTWGTSWFQSLASVMLEPEHVLVRQVERVHTKCWVCVLSCLLLACVYVGSLYVWRSSLPRYTNLHLHTISCVTGLLDWAVKLLCVCVCVSRDHPTVIKRRCASVLLVAALSPVAVKAWTHWAEIRVSSRGRKFTVFLFNSPFGLF